MKVPLNQKAEYNMIIHPSERKRMDFLSFNQGVGL
jgi:hypothetical protein